VSRLVLLDAPCPLKLEPVPSKLFRFFDAIGALGNGNPKGTPAWVIPHFEAMIRNMDHDPQLGLVCGAEVSGGEGATGVGHLGTGWGV